MKIIDHPVEYYCRTADDYYKKLPRPAAMMHKPFASLIEAPHIMTKLGPLLEGLQLGKKMTVVDFGAGTCWLSRFLAMLDCCPIAVDVSPTALDLGRRLFREWGTLDEPLEEPRFLLFDGRRIDLPDGSVDRVVCFESLHHVPNVDEVLAELYRILVPGGIAGFAEPGDRHSEAPFSQAEMLNYDVLELDVFVEEIWKTAKSLGFTDIRFRLFSFPTADFSLEERSAIIEGRIPEPLVTHVAESMKSWSIFFLHKGQPVLDSRGVAGLRGNLEIIGGPATVPAGEPFAVEVRCSNTGDAAWLGAEAVKGMGSVRVGPHLYDGGMRLLNFEMRRTILPERVAPGDSVDATVAIGPLAPGEYVLTFDLVAEFVTWFEARGFVPPKLRVSVR
jgi:SAM-dependent methyltransferase